MGGQDVVLCAAVLALLLIRRWQLAAFINELARGVREFKQGVGGGGPGGPFW